MARVARFAQTTLKPRMLHTDSEGVPTAIISMLGRAGALNHLASPRFGGAGLAKAEDRRVHEHLAAGCLNTWLIWAQHASIAARVEAALEGADPGHDLIDGLLRGRVFAGAALSDVRHYPERFIAADRAKGGWQFRGTVSWASGWGLNEVLLIAGVDAVREQVVLALVPISERFTASPLHLAALGGSRTFRVDLDGVFVEDSLVISIEPLAAWQSKDDQTAVDAKPHLFGLAAAVLEELRNEPHALARDAAAAWAPRVEELRSQAYALADAGDASNFYAERLGVRVQTGEALSTISKALLVARAGRSLQRNDSAQYYLRSAHFLLVQAQTDAVRAAQLARLG
nr:acyl-CoA dehydrogenase family protein [Arthrobacter sp. H-02-3]